MHLRTTEWINLLAFSVFAGLAWFRRGLDTARRVKITATGVGGLTITLLVAFTGVGVIRDWIPLALLPMFYWQAGQFVTGANEAAEKRLLQWDRWLAAPLLEGCARAPFGAAIFTYLELSYFSYYLAIPGSLATLYFTGGASGVDRFWTVVLLAAYLSCSTLPFLQTRPPRVLGEKWKVALPAGRMRAFNLWILREGSIQANTCPSAHVAITMASSLALFQLAPVWAGLVFLWVAISVACGAVGGRYHYAADAILGVLVALAAFLSGATLPSS